ncbi:MAG TPA: 2-oxoacid:acceptor oxidoreductase subunit alpha, partial [bacterium]|nr:2-oxoacid:acceptor oxidoreductase subunit alpha [bacterium]
EISAVNMSLGAWFAGARALVTTSGGGFALMAEGLSLAGAIESPAVIHLAQRPGPATGLPTRTEQGDLLFALFAGHGEFPRILLAPGSLEEAFSLSREAFNLADRFQVPVVVLTDQYLLDSHYDLAPFDLEGFSVEKALVESSPEYRRYAFTDTGISPRGVPGFGDGLVCADSDEHDQSGHITESMVVRTAMVDKRLKKAAAIEKAVPAPEFFGDEDYRLLVLGWGSTREALIESLEGLKGEGVGYLHFSWIHPLWPDLGDWMKRARRTVAVENNATGQFARLIRMTTGQEVAGSVRKYDGLPFSVEELSAAVKRELSR